MLRLDSGLILLDWMPFTIILYLHCENGTLQTLDLISWNVSLESE